ncbi:hypothetical protein OWR29_30165 [Actinoplanes sp. Pm04-4]|uniref:Uncharacterized protein n=1 Tax=Paractinoplanes pyxinae TaxID=2997416 RepID=A0ABT4B6Z6_9ACTN|nr:hypothetical protein [Actinoplanes pyxinae]MCY1142282.1 hypothetical protein [Actinoplanes pyxinae]
MGAAAPGRAVVEGGSDLDDVPPAGEPKAPVVGARAAAARAAAADDDAGQAGGFLERLRTQRRLRVVTLVSLAAVVLVVLPAFFGLRAASSDPVFSSLDSLEVPAWAEQKVDDQSSGSKWCFIDCTFRERTAESQKPIKDTTAAYTSALTSAGWAPWTVGECPEVPIAKDDPTTYTCFKRDEFTLDLRVSQPECQVDQVAANDPSVAGATAPPVPAKGECVGSAVSIKVQNAIADTRGKPDPQKSPLIGETPDTVLTEDPLLEPTPSAS